MAIIGFTGTRFGMNALQMDQFVEVMRLQYALKMGVHGGCIGADEQFHQMFKQSSIPVEVRPGYPSRNPSDTSNHFDYSDANTIHEAKPYFDRNRTIVNQCNLLIAAPPCNVNPGKGGTWYTIEYAKKQHVPTIILWRE